MAEQVTLSNEESQNPDKSLKTGVDTIREDLEANGSISSDERWTAAQTGTVSSNSLDLNAAETLRQRAEELLQSSSEDENGDASRMHEIQAFEGMNAQQLEEHGNLEDSDSNEDQPLLPEVVEEEAPAAPHQLAQPVLMYLENQSDRSSTSHRLSRALYGEVDSRLREQLSYSIILSMFLDFCIYVVPVAIFSTHVNFEATCGVPILHWLTGLYLIVGIANIMKLSMYLVVQYCRSSRFILGIGSSTLVFTVLFYWLLYGNLIYFSRKNDCFRRRETRLLTYLMLGYLYVGYIQIGYALSYVYILPHAIQKWWELRQRTSAFQDQIRQISETLARKDFDPTVHKFESTCAICLEDFNKQSQVTTLECHTKHIFHSVCLDRWITDQHNTCPVCRESIIPDLMDPMTYEVQQEQVINSLRRDEDVRRLGHCPFSWPF